MALSPRERTIASVAGIVLGAGVLYSLVLDPLLVRLDDAQAARDKNSADLLAANTLLSRRDRDNREWKSIAGRMPKEESAAESALLNRVRDAAQNAGLQVRNLQRKATDREQGFGRILFGVSATGGMSRISRFMHALQTSEIPLRVADVTITSAANKEGTDDLFVTMTVATLVDSPPPQKVARGVGGAEVFQ